MAKGKREYSSQTKRHATQFPGVYQREAERVIGKTDIVFDISYKKDGKKIWEKIGWKSQGYSADLARQLRNERIISMQHGEELPQDKKKAPFFKDAASKFLDWAKENRTRAGIDERIRYEKYLRHFDNTRMDAITSFDIERLKSDLGKAGLAPATVKHVLVLLRQVYNKAITGGLYQGANPIKGVKLPTLSNERIRFFSYEEADTLLRALKERSPLTHDVTVLSLQCGLRFSEIAKLRGENLSFERGQIHIVDSKNKDSRLAFMTDEVRAILLQRTPKNPNDLVFPSKTGGQMDGVSNIYQQTVNTLGFNNNRSDRRQRVVFHSCRHTFCSWLAIEGTPLHIIAELAGHKTLSMTRRYSHLTPDVKKTAVMNIGGIFAKARGKVVTINKEG